MVLPHMFVAMLSGSQIAWKLSRLGAINVTADLSGQNDLPLAQYSYKGSKFRHGAHLDSEHGRRSTALVLSCLPCESCRYEAMPKALLIQDGAIREFIRGCVHLRHLSRALIYAPNASWITVDATGSQKAKNPAFAGLSGGFSCCIGCCWNCIWWAVLGSNQ